MIDQYSIYALTNKQILAELGKSMRRKRINANLTQKMLAERAGISQITVISMEKGGNISMETYISVLRELHELGSLYTLSLRPEPIAPDILFKAAQRQRRRVRISKNDAV